MKRTVDIAVIGGGPSGCAAAVAARRFGANVLLLEKDGSLGGMAGPGMLSNLCGDAESGFYRRFLKALAPRPFPPRKVFSPERVKEVLAEEVLASGAKVLLHAALFGCDAENGRVTAARFAVRGGVLEVEARIFIDSTGDGELAALAGVPFDLGRTSDGLCQPMTLEFLIGGLDPERARFFEVGKSAETKAALKKWLAEGRMPHPVDRILVTQGPEKTTAYVNSTNVIARDPTDPFALTKAELEARGQIAPLIAFLREEVPGYENAVLLSSAPYIGTRESRRFHGKTTLTEEDLAAGRTFSDRVTAGATFSFDLHDPEGRASAQEKPRYTGAYYTVPYGALVPENRKGLLLNGRCISGTHTAHSSYRVIPIAMAIGEGAGTCAAVALKNKSEVTLLSPPEIEEVQNLLKERKETV